MRNPEAERFVREVWAVFQRDGVPAVLELAWPDARWRPHSAHGHRFESTEEYRAALARLTDEARGTTNLMPAILEAVQAYATLGEISRAMKDVFGEHKEPTRW